MLAVAAATICVYFFLHFRFVCWINTARWYIEWQPGKCQHRSLLTCNLLCCQRQYLCCAFFFVCQNFGASATGIKFHQQRPPLRIQCIRTSFYVIHLKINKGTSTNIRSSIDETISSACNIRSSSSSFSCAMHNNNVFEWTDRRESTCNTK